MCQKDGWLVKCVGADPMTTKVTLYSKRRKVSAALALIGLRSRDELGLPPTEIARHVAINTSSIIRSIERAEKSSADAKHN